MAVYIISRRIWQAGERDTTPPISVPPGLTSLRTQINMDNLYLTDPDTNVACGMEISNDGGQTWNFLFGTGLQGGPLNDPNLPVYCQLNGAVLNQIVGYLFRAFLQTATVRELGLIVTVL